MPYHPDEIKHAKRHDSFNLSILPKPLKDMEITSTMLPCITKSIRATLDDLFLQTQGHKTMENK